jgi:Terminase large subunit, T4likevirus-type, N-terminal
MSPNTNTLNLLLHDKQMVALETPATEILYGGAAGGGKSHLMRVAAISWCCAVNGLQVYMYRRIWGDLLLNHMEGPSGFRAMLASMALAGRVSIVENEIRFDNGSRIFLCHCEHEKHVYKYQGAEIHVLLIDELTHFTEQMYRFLRSRVRMVGVNVPYGYRNCFPRILCSANPGNIGHLWVKQFWIAGCPPGSARQMPAAEGGMKRVFIPARLDDNPSMLEADPGYEAKLEGLGSAALVAAMRWGDWDVVEGAFFDCWSNHKHVIAPFDIPDDWP